MAYDLVAIFITCASRKEAGAIARSLVNKRLAACANIASGLESIFRWKGKVEKAAEVLMIAKAPAKNFKAVEREVRRMHSYEVPEIIAVPVACGSGEYLKWVKESTL